MASDKNYLNFILEQLSSIPEITYKPMMSEYLFYYKGKLFGGIYDNRFLVKPTQAVITMLPNSTFETPYEGAKAMLAIENIESPLFLKELLDSMYDELPPLKEKKNKK